MTTKKKEPIHISVDGELKVNATKLFKELGIDMTTAITIFLKQSVAKQGIPFMIEKGNPLTLQAVQDANEGKVCGGFSSVDELMEDLNA